MPETHAFKSELKQILHLITHSLYSHKEIFLRELISNGSDAIDKIRFNSLQNEHLLEGDRDWRIRLAADPEAGTLTVSDNGIGMDREAVVEHLGTIAKSGTRAFLERLQETEPGSRPGLIGQFGVGFYSAFMVADRVTVVSRAAGEAGAVRWCSDGQGEFTVEDAERAGRGTDVILHLKESEREFLQEWRLRAIVKQFSDFIEHPVVTAVDKGEGRREDEVLNSRKALWLRGKSDVSAEEHEAFHRQITGDFEAPLKVVHYAAEGALEFRVLLTIPRHKTWELQFGEPKVGPRLYVNRVLIMESCEALLPPWLRFVKGVVDCSDLPLNVSRETLQHNPILDKIRASVVKNVLQALAELQAAEPEAYAAFFRELGGILKEGVARGEGKEALADLLLFPSLAAPEPRSLAAAVEAMPEGQDALYYLAGEDRAALEQAPALEAFRQRGWDVLLLTEPIDEFVVSALPSYRGKDLKAADRHAPELPVEGRQAAAEAVLRFQPLLDRIKGGLAGLKDVRLSTRLTDSAACLVADPDALSPNLERLLQKMGQATPGAAPRILELNPEHPLVAGMLAIHQGDPDDPRLATRAQFLHDQALLAEGARLPDAKAFVQRLNDLLLRDPGAPTRCS